MDRGEESPHPVIRCDDLIARDIGRAKVNRAANDGDFQAIERHDFRLKCRLNVLYGVAARAGGRERHGLQFVVRQIAIGRINPGERICAIGQRNVLLPDAIGIRRAPADVLLHAQTSHLDPRQCVESRLGQVLLPGDDVPFGALNGHGTDRHDADNHGDAEYGHVDGSVAVVTAV